MEATTQQRQTCYRHPSRETGVSCSNCARPICPECMTATPVGMRCPECANQRTRARTIRSTSDEPTLTYLLIGLNVLVFLGGALGGASATGGGGLGGSTLLTEGALSRAEVADGEYWRLLTSGFLHAGLFHLLFNMLSLWILGSLLEPAVGRLRFALIYLVSLLCGSFGALLLEPDGLTVGASGAIFGLMAAAAVYARNRGLSLMESGLGIWIVLNLVITFTVPNISIGGHIGGLIGGGLAALVLFDLGDQVRLPQQALALICGALGVVAVAGSIVVAGSA
jgi:membrane associated rhomboid family serine protease